MTYYTRPQGASQHELLLDCVRCKSLVRVCGMVDDLEPPYVCLECRIAASGVVWDQTQGGPDGLAG